MPLSAVIQLQALRDARLEAFTGRGVHGFWFKHWERVDADIANALHAATQSLPPFSLSPLMGLPRAGRGGEIAIEAGQRAWLRVSILEDGLAQAAREKWLASLETGSRIMIPEDREEAPGVGWQVAGVSGREGAHPLAGEVSYEALAQGHLMNSNPPRQWKMEFSTPTAFHGKNGHLPFPLPESLVGSWLRRWQAFAPLALPEDELTAWARSNLAVSAFRLQTLPAREGERLRVGCVGWLKLRALETPPYLRAAIDLLAAYAQYCGSGAHTAQGMGQTRCLEAWGSGSRE